MKKSIWVSLLLLSMGAEVSGQQPGFIRDSLETYILKGMADWQIPGLALTIVKDGKVVIQKGYGVQQIDQAGGRPNKVDVNTLFLIASNTKLFTATALAMLHEEKKLDLDRPLTTYLPDFALYDTAATRLVTIRDLLSHRLGTASNQGDFGLWNSNLSRQEVMYRMRYLPPRYPFRTEFGYSNAAYVTAGEVIPKVTGLPWSEYVENLILKPLHMDHTYMRTEDIVLRENVAIPYTVCCNTDGRLTRLPMDHLDNLGAATGMVSNVSDLTKWLLLQTDSGRVDNRRILPWSVLNQTRKANTIVSTQKHPFFPLKYQFYCLGVGLLDYAGYNAFVHSGGAFGYHTNVVFVPELKLGFAILTNQDNSMFHEALLWQILDAYMKVPYTNRHQYFLEKARIRGKKSQEVIKGLEQRVSQRKPLPIPLTAYTGTYNNPLYGTITIQAEKGPQLNGANLGVRFQHHPDLTTQLDYMDNHEFRLTFSNPRWGIIPINFTISNNQVKQVEIRVSDFVDSEPYVFRKL